MNLVAIFNFQRNCLVFFFIIKWILCRSEERERERGERERDEREREEREREERERKRERERGSMLSLRFGDDDDILKHMGLSKIFDFERSQQNMRNVSGTIYSLR